MKHAANNTEFKLSRDFQVKAEAADIQSYRIVRMEITHHIPGFPHLLEKLPHQLYDRVETGLYDLVILRAALENPLLAVHLLPYLSGERSEQPVPGELNAIRNRVKRQFNLAALPKPMHEKELANLLRRTDAEMDLRLQYLKDLPQEFGFSFAGESDISNIGRLESSPDTRYLPLTKKMLSDWLVKPVGEKDPQPLQASAPLQSVQVSLSPVRARDLDDARRRVDDVLNQGRRIVALDDRKMKLVLF
ncbi:MAG: hypothetical protein ACXW4B_10385 [Micavibrio sp.]